MRKGNLIAGSTAVSRSKGRSNGLRCIMYLMMLWTGLIHRLIRAERAVSAKLDGHIVQEVVKSLSSVKVDTKDGEKTDSDDGEELTESDHDAIKTIISQISAWMDMKRQRDLSKTQSSLFENKIQAHRPFVTLAYAQTLDGMIAATLPSKIDENKPTSNLQLSCPQSLILTHRLRNMHDAIIVGGTTFLVDAPRLNVRLSSNIMRESLIEQPFPVVLDTHLKSLQKLLWGQIIPLKNEDEEVKHAMPQDMHPQNIRSNNPVICCSPDAAKIFLDHLELFQQQQIPVKKIDEFPGNLNQQQKRVYTVTVYKMIDGENDHEEDQFLPIKITVQVTLEGNKIEESDSITKTFTLLPCKMHKNNGSLDLQNVLQQLNKQFQIESVMVEGGSSILSSFMNESVSSCKDKKNDGKKLIDCICTTISPLMIGTGGLPVLQGLDVANGEREIKGDAPFSPIRLGDGKFAALGRDCTFLCRL